MRPLSARRKCWLCYPDQSHKVRDRRLSQKETSGQVWEWEYDRHWESYWGADDFYVARYQFRLLALRGLTQDFWSIILRARKLKKSHG